MQRMFQNLPTEVLEAIIDHLHPRKDRKALWRVSRRFSGLLTTRVFETLTIRAKEHALAQLDARPYASLDATRPLDCLKLVEHLHLRAPFHEKIDDGRCPCPHDEVYEPPDPLTDIWPNPKFQRWLKLVPLLEQLQENGLVSFRWDLGMCIPNQILGPEGYLTKKQTAIESLSLVNDMSCPGYLDENYFCNRLRDGLVLSQFPKLRRFSWKGLRWPEQLGSLRDLFKNNHRVLENLELDFIDWSEVRFAQLKIGFGDDSDDSDEIDASFTGLILPHKINGDVEKFGSLSHLALSAFAFEQRTLEITQALNIESLQSLKLLNCPRVLTFLSTIVDAGLVMRLKSLELILRDTAVEHDGQLESPLISFLQPFNGLEYFHLMLRVWLGMRTLRPEHWPSCYWNAILHHSSTMKTLVYHEQRNVFGNEQHSDLYEYWADRELYKPNVGDSDAERTHFLENHFYNSALAQMQLECFGIADRHDMVRLVMSTPSVVEQNFKLLHFRRTGISAQRREACGDEPRFKDQVRALVKHNPSSWSRDDYLQNLAKESPSVFDTALQIFQSPKFDKLQILAFGDFSHGGRYKWQHLLLCRAVTPNPEVRFRVMSQDDVEFYKRSGLLSLDFLAACPSDTLQLAWSPMP